MRVISALGLCSSEECEVYRPNEKTQALTQPIGRDGVPCMYVAQHRFLTALFRVLYR